MTAQPDRVTASKDTEYLTSGHSYEVLRTMGDAHLVLLTPRKTAWITKDNFKQ